MWSLFFVNPRIMRFSFFVVVSVVVMERKRKIFNQKTGLIDSLLWLDRV